MSLTELKSEIAQLSAPQLEALRSAIETELAKKQQPKQFANFAEYAASLRGTVILKPGWDDDEPLEEWNAEHDDTPL
ncbi:MAG: hypothetical protein V7609_1737 [Verrucomicrobiota bacterium]